MGTHIWRRKRDHILVVKEEKDGEDAGVLKRGNAVGRRGGDVAAVRGGAGQCVTS